MQQKVQGMLQFGWVEHPARHIIRHFSDDLPSQPPDWCK